MLTFEEEEEGAEVCAIDASSEDGKILGVGFNSRKDVKGVLRKTKVFSKRSTEMVRERGGPRNEVKRDAAKERAGMGGLPDSGGSKGDGAETVRGELGSEQGSTKGRVGMHRLESRNFESAESFPKK